MRQVDIPFEERFIGKFLRQQAERKTDHLFLTINGKSLTFGETDEFCRGVARGLRKFGLGVESRVMMMLPNCIEFVITAFATSLLGAIEIPINPALKGILLESIIGDCRPDAIVVHGSLADELTKIDPGLLPRYVIVVGRNNTIELANVHVSAFEEIDIRQGDDPETTADWRRIRSILYTSGTTGPSKGVVVTTAASFCPPINYIKIMGMSEGDSIYSPLPLFHGLSSRHGVMPSLVLGTHITIDERFSASRYWERAAECRATLGMVVHAIVPLLKGQPPRASDRAHQLRCIFNVKHDAEFEERFGITTVEAYALTETSHVLNTPYPERRWGSTGRVANDWEVRIVDADDREVQRGTAGELVCRPKSPHIMMMGYLNKPEVTLEATRNLWYHTGDILREDEDGYFYYLDRKKDRIRRRGENISSADVEMNVCAHPDVAECAVIAQPEGDGEDHIRAIIVLKKGARLEPRTLYNWLGNQMPKIMLPRYLEFVTEIPRTGTGKFEKHRLAQGGLGASVWDAEQVDR